MASYTIEDIELIRRKSGISYQEAVALLDYHNGNVARALVDLERNGRIKPEAEQQKPKSASSSKKAHESKSALMRMLSKAYHFRIKVKKEQITIINLSLLFTLLALLISPHLVLVGIVLMLILGYKVSVDKSDKDFTGANLEKMVRNAAQNVKDSVTSMAQELGGNERETEAPKEPEAKPQEDKKDDRSYYQANPAATTYHASYGGSAPTLQVPVQVESQDGKVTMESDKDGFTSATIE